MVTYTRAEVYKEGKLVEVVLPDPQGNFAFHVDISRPEYKVLFLGQNVVAVMQRQHVVAVMQRQHVVVGLQSGVQQFMSDEEFLRQCGIEKL